MFRFSEDLSKACIGEANVFSNKRAVGIELGCGRGRIDCDRAVVLIDLPVNLRE